MADGTFLRDMVGLAPLCMGDGAQDLGDDLPGLPDQNPVADAEVPLGDEVLIVEHRPADGGSGQDDGVEYRRRGAGSGAAHVDLNLPEGGFLFLGGILEGHGPAGKFRRCAQALPVGEVVHLDHRAVDVEGVFAPHFADVPDLGHGVLDVVEPPVGRDHLKAQPMEGVQGLLMGGDFQALDLLKVKDEDVQLPGRRDLGVLLPEAARGGVPGIFERFFLVFQLLGHQGFKHRPGHVDLSPDLHKGHRFRQLFGDGGNGAEI